MPSKSDVPDVRLLQLQRLREYLLAGGGEMAGGGELGGKGSAPLRWFTNPGMAERRIGGTTPARLLEKGVLPDVAGTQAQRQRALEKLNELFFGRGQGPEYPTGRVQEQPTLTKRDLAFIREKVKQAGGGRLVAQVETQRNQMKMQDARALKRDTRWVEPPEIWEGWREGDPFQPEDQRRMGVAKKAEDYVRRLAKWGGQGNSPPVLLRSLEARWKGKGKETFAMKRFLVGAVLNQPGAESLTFAQMREAAPDLAGAWRRSLEINAKGGSVGGPLPSMDWGDRKQTGIERLRGMQRVPQGQVPDVPGQKMLLPELLRGEKRAKGVPAGWKPRDLSQMALALAQERPAAANALSNAAFYQSQGYEAGSEFKKAKKLMEGAEASGGLGAHAMEARGDATWEKDQRRETGRAKALAAVEAEMQATKSTRDRERLEKKWWRLTQGGRPQDPEGQRKWDMEQEEWDAATRQNREMGRLEEKREVVDLKKRFEKVSGQLPDVPGQTFLQNPRDKGALLWAGRVTKGQFGLSIPREKKGVGWEGMRNLMRIREAAEASEPGAIAFMREAGIPLDLRGVTPEGLRAGQVFKGGMQKGMRQLLKLLAVLPK